MSYTQAALVVLLSALGALGLSYTVHKLVRVETRVRHHEVGAAIFLQLGVLFAVLLAFVFSEAFSQYDDAQRAIDLECGALHGAAMLSSTLPPQEARPLLQIEVNYIRDVVVREWPSLREHRQRDNTAALALTGLVQQAARLPLATASEGPVKAELLSLLTSAHSQREVRLYEAEDGIPIVLWVILIGFSGVLMTFVAFSGVQNYLSLVLFAITFATCVSAILVLVRLLNYPFEGAIGLSSGDFAETLDKVLVLLRAVSPSPSG